MKAGSAGLRTGFSTGACAAAAAKAAMLAMVRRQLVNDVEIALPGGQPARFDIKECTFDPAGATCSVIKDAGDDPDVTDGAEVRATVRWTDVGGVTISGGVGVGRVTKPGLDIPPGEPAINPVPRQMVRQAVAEAAGQQLDGRGVEVCISVPDGERLARRTLNSRLGIVGGISILGTSGTVIPYSVDAYTACIRQSLDVAVACGCREAVLTTGRRSEMYAQKELGLREECFVQAGDYIGYSLEECARKGLRRATVWGMVGKVGKLASGHLYTNVSDSVVSIDFLAHVAEESGVPQSEMAALRGAVTANHFRKMLPAGYLRGFYDRLCLLAAEKCSAAAGGKLVVRCIVTDPEGVVLGRASARA